jgi:MerR family mercuric resistance operon transcriptional regulator
MRIGEFSRLAGVSVQAIRFYERRRLLKKPPRTSSGYRIYSEQDLENVKVIRQCQHFRFTLREIRRILSLFAVPDERTGGSVNPYGKLFRYLFVYNGV